MTIEEAARILYPPHLRPASERPQPTLNGSPACVITRVLFPPTPPEGAYVERYVIDGCRALPTLEEAVSWLVKLGTDRSSLLALAGANEEWVSKWSGRTWSEWTPN